MRNSFDKRITWEMCEVQNFHVDVKTNYTHTEHTELQ